MLDADVDTAIRFYPVSQRVNKPSYDAPDCVEPLNGSPCTLAAFRCFALAHDGERAGGDVRRSGKSGIPAEFIARPIAEPR